MRFFRCLLYSCLLLAIIYPAGRSSAQIIFDPTGPLKIIPDGTIPINITPIPVQWVQVQGSPGELANPHGWGDSYLRGDRLLIGTADGLMQILNGKRSFVPGIPIDFTGIIGMNDGLLWIRQEHNGILGLDPQSLVIRTRYRKMPDYTVCIRIEKDRLWCAQINNMWDPHQQFRHAGNTLLPTDQLLECDLNGNIIHDWKLDEKRFGTSIGSWVDGDAIWMLSFTPTTLDRIRETRCLLHRIDRHTGEITDQPLAYQPADDDWTDWMNLHNSLSVAEGDGHAVLCFPRKDGKSVLLRLDPTANTFTPWITLPNKYANLLIQDAKLWCFGSLDTLVLDLQTGRQIPEPPTLPADTPYHVLYTRGKVPRDYLDGFRILGYDNTRVWLLGFKTADDRILFEIRDDGTAWQYEIPAALREQFNTLYSYALAPDSMQPSDCRVAIMHGALCLFYRDKAGAENAHLLVLQPGGGAVGKYILPSRTARLCGNLRGDNWLWLHGLRTLYAVSPDLRVQEIKCDRRFSDNTCFVEDGNKLYWMDIDDPRQVYLQWADAATGKIDRLLVPNMEIFTRDGHSGRTAPVSDRTGTGFYLTDGQIAFGYSNDRRYPAMYSGAGLSPNVAIFCIFDPKIRKWHKIITGAFINRPVASPSAVWAISPEEEYLDTICTLEPSGWQPRRSSPPLLRLEAISGSYYYPITNANGEGATAGYIYAITAAGLCRIRWAELE